MRNLDGLYRPITRCEKGMKRQLMRLGLIGSTGHWQTYAPRCEHVPDLTLVAVAAAGPEETTGAFDHAPGLTVDTRRYDDARKMLDAERLDVVQVAAATTGSRSGRTICLERGLPVMAEKPLAMDLPTLEGLFQAAQKTKAALVPMHTMRSVPALAAVQQAVRAGAIGEPLMSFSQKTYKWGKTRPDFYREPQDVSRPRALGRHSRLRLAALDPGRRVHRGARARGDDGAPRLSGLRQSGGLRADDAKRRRGIGHARLSAPGSRPHARGRTPAHRRHARRHRDRLDRAEGDAHHRRTSRRARFP